MPLFPSFHFKKKPTKKEFNEQRVNEMLKESLSPFMTKEDVDKYLQKIERDKEKRRIWNSMTARQKMKLLLYLSSKRGDKK